jgi:hypothetical protein
MKQVLAPELFAVNLQIIHLQDNILLQEAVAAVLLLILPSRQVQEVAKVILLQEVVVRRATVLTATLLQAAAAQVVAVAVEAVVEVEAVALAEVAGNSLVVKRE